MSDSVFRLGTRSSDLALYQANAVRDALLEKHSEVDIEIIHINTSGDWRPEHGETRLSEAEGGKGLFAKEIEEAILAGYVDFGVHSLKDMPSFLPDNLTIHSVLQRANPFDAFLSNQYSSFRDLPAGSTVGTSSTRRAAVLLNNRDDIKIVPLRGNVPTRIEKMKNGQADAIILAAAGLMRLGLDDEIAEVFDRETMLPASCQGIINVEYRTDDERTRNFLTVIRDTDTEVRMLAERACLQVLNGSCQTPICAYVAIEDHKAVLSAQVYSLDGTQKYDFEHVIDLPDGIEDRFVAAIALGKHVGEALKSVVPPELLLV